MTHPTDLDSVLASIWARRGPQVLADVQEMHRNAKDLSLLNAEALATKHEKVHELIGVFGILQFANCVELCRSTQEILNGLRNQPNNRDSLAQLEKLTQDLRDAVAARLPENEPRLIPD